MNNKYTFDVRLGKEHIRLLTFEATNEAMALNMAKKYAEDVLQWYPDLIHPTELHSLTYKLKSVK